MALLEVSTRIAIVQLRGRHAMQATTVADPRRGVNSDAPRSQSPARPARAGSRSIVRTAVTDSEQAQRRIASGSRRLGRGLRSACIASDGRCVRSAGR